MPEQNKSSDIMGVFKDIWATGTQELSKNVSSMLSSTPPPTNTTSSSVGSVLGGSVPSGSGNQISVAQEKREKDVIEKRKG